VAATTVRKDDALPLLSSRVTVTLDDGGEIVERVANSREEVRIDWDTVAPWAADIFEQAGKDRHACEGTMAAVRDLAAAPHVDTRLLAAFSG
jgi:hypothetical protein